MDFDTHELCRRPCLYARQAGRSPDRGSAVEPALNLIGTATASYIGTLETAQIIGVSAALMRLWRSEGRGPEFVRLCPSTILYRQGMVEAFARKREAGADD